MKEGGEWRGRERVEGGKRSGVWVMERRVECIEGRRGKVGSKMKDHMASTCNASHSMHRLNACRSETIPSSLCTYNDRHQSAGVMWLPNRVAMTLYSMIRCWY